MLVLINYCVYILEVWVARIARLSFCRQCISVLLQHQILGNVIIKNPSPSPTNIHTQPIPNHSQPTFITFTSNRKYQFVSSSLSLYSSLYGHHINKVWKIIFLYFNLPCAVVFHFANATRTLKVETLIPDLTSKGQFMFQRRGCDHLISLIFGGEKKE